MSKGYTMHIQTNLLPDEYDAFEQLRKGLGLTKYDMVRRAIRAYMRSQIRRAEKGEPT